MKTCSNCGAQVGDNNSFCVKCGAPMAETPVNPTPVNPTPVNSTPVNSAQAGGTPPQMNMNQQNMGYQQNAFQQNAYQPQQPVIPNWDHTSEFDEKDVSDNKVLGMCAYLDVTFGVVGVIIALLGSATSKFAAFHARQALKIVIAQILFTVCWAITLAVVGGIGALISIRAWATIWVVFLFLYGAGYVVLFVARIVGFFQVCKGKSVEPIIMRHFGFMR